MGQANYWQGPGQGMVRLKKKIRLMQDEWGDAWTPGLEEG